MKNLLKAVFAITIASSVLAGVFSACSTPSSDNGSSDNSSYSNDSSRGNTIVEVSTDFSGFEEQSSTENSSENSSENSYTGLAFSRNQNGGYSVSWDEISTAETLSIPSVYNGLPVNAIAEGGFCDNSFIRTVVIPDSVTEICESAFANCCEISSLTIGSGVTSIGSGAFGSCRKITSLSLPRGLTDIGENAFLDCRSTQSIVVASGNARYKSEGNCLIETATKTILFGCKNSVIPSDGSVTVIGADAFRYCEGLSTLSIPSCVTDIGERAFYQCSDLSRIVLPEGIPSIGDYTFADCRSLSSITIPASVNSIGTGAFYNCEYLSSATFANANGWVVSAEKDASSGVSLNLSDPVANARYLIDQFKEFYWKRG